MKRNRFEYGNVINYVTQIQVRPNVHLVYLVKCFYWQIGRELFNNSNPLLGNFNFLADVVSKGEFGVKNETQMFVFIYLLNFNAIEI